MAPKTLTLGLFLTLIGSSIGRADGGRLLFSFDTPGDATRWSIVNDGVMGGRSSSDVSIVTPPDSAPGGGGMRFAGNLSLANNGGFASVRSAPIGGWDLRADDTFILRVRGDGRTYTLNLYPDDRRTAFSFQQDFPTQSGRWIEARLPVSGFVASSYGRDQPGIRLDPARIRSIGILLGDKQPGPFNLIVDSIQLE